MQGAASIIVVNDASCLIDLRKARLLHLLSRLPYRFMIPLPVRASELLDFTPQEWAILDAGMETFDLPPARVSEAFEVKAIHPKLSANDCFCLVTTRFHQNAILLTGDGLLRRVARKRGLPVHGVLWVVDELLRLALCEADVLIGALEIWRHDVAVFLPASEIERRLRPLRLA
jgi:predicted nucleic acid-binding protein